jgi:hypothetical protein
VLADLLPPRARLPCTDSSRYFIIEGHFTQAEAADACYASNLTLATINTPDDLANAMQAADKRAVWIGLAASVAGNRWVWANGDAASFTHWGRHVPLLEIPTVAAGSCAVMWTDGSWSAKGCSEKQHVYMASLPALCEAKPLCFTNFVYGMVFHGTDSEQVVAQSSFFHLKHFKHIYLRLCCTGLGHGGDGGERRRQPLELPGTPPSFPSHHAVFVIENQYWYHGIGP